MGWVFAFPLWYTFDDHLAAGGGALGTPGLGELPIWVALLAAGTLHAVTAQDLSEQFGKLRRELRRGKNKA